MHPPKTVRKKQKKLKENKEINQYQYLLTNIQFQDINAKKPSQHLKYKNETHKK